MGPGVSAGGLSAPPSLRPVAARFVKAWRPTDATASIGQNRRSPHVTRHEHGTLFGQVPQQLLGGDTDHVM
jgi:hypothetical protein